MTHPCARALKKKQNSEFYLWKNKASSSGSYNEDQATNGLKESRKEAVEKVSKIKIMNNIGHPFVTRINVGKNLDLAG